MAELPDLVPRHIAMGLALVEEESGIAEGAVIAESAAELPKMGVFAVLVAQQGLLMAALVATVATGVEWGRRARVVLRSHVLLQLVLPLASKGTHLTHQGLALMPQLVATQLISPVAAIRALVALVSGKEERGAVGRGGRNHSHKSIITIDSQEIHTYYGPGSILSIVHLSPNLIFFYTILQNRYPFYSKETLKHRS